MISAIYIIHADWWGYYYGLSTYAGQPHPIDLIPWPYLKQNLHVDLTHEGVSLRNVKFDEHHNLAIF